jgi:hypothetical protein
MLARRAGCVHPDSRRGQREILRASRIPLARHHPGVAVCRHLLGRPASTATDNWSPHLRGLSHRCTRVRPIRVGHLPSDPGAGPHGSASGLAGIFLAGDECRRRSSTAPPSTSWSVTTVTDTGAVAYKDDHGYASSGPAGSGSVRRDPRRDAGRSALGLTRITRRERGPSRSMRPTTAAIPWPASTVTRPSPHLQGLRLGGCRSRPLGLGRRVPRSSATSDGSGSLRRPRQCGPERR